MSAFHAPVDDILFSMQQVARADRLPGWDSALATEILNHFATFAEERIAPLDAVGDQIGCQLENGRVRMPEGFKEVFSELVESGWQGLTLPEKFGGQGLSHLLQAGYSEIFTGANHSLQMICCLVPGAAGVLERFGTEDQKERFLPLLAEGRWVSTMALTEPGAGSDLSRIRCRANKEGDGWKLTGEKIFISGGDQDMSEGILHLVLARSGEDGIKGLSLFACPSVVAGERNAVSVTRIEDKMGLHAQPTCHLAFDGAHAELIGVEGKGLAAMFTMMNDARLDVALQGVAHAARAADIARRYASERVQGRDKAGHPITIDGHADVARMIETCEQMALGARALCHIVMVEDELGSNSAFVDFMTPVCKYLGTEVGARAADIAIDVLGGYGYLREYGAEQNFRDARICKIYEGTNGIHARTTVTRGLSAGSGAGAHAFAEFLRDCGIEPEPWEAEAKRLSESSFPEVEAHKFMRLTCEAAYRAAWSRIAAAGGRGVSEPLHDLF